MVDDTIAGNEDDMGYEKDELLLPQQAENIIRWAHEILSEKNVRRKKRKIRNFAEFPVAKWPMPIRYKIDGTFSKSIILIIVLLYTIPNG